MNPGTEPRTEPTTGLTAEASEGVTSPADRPIAALAFGTTADEQLAGEPLDGRLVRERPDPVLEEIERLASGSAVDPYPTESLGASGASAGRLVDIDEGVRTDDVAEAIGVDVGSDDGAFSAEEAAMHIVAEDEAGLTDDPDGYLTGTKSAATD